MKFYQDNKDNNSTQLYNGITTNLCNQWCITHKNLYDDLREKLCWFVNYDISHLLHNRL